MGSLVIEFFLFWLLLLFISEVCVTRNVSYGVSMLFGLILTMVVFLFWYEFDLFASILLALYSSVFLLLSLFILYFNRYWGKTSSTWYSDAALLDFGIGVSVLFAPCCFIVYEGTLILNGGVFSAAGIWYLRFVSYDYIGLLQDLEVMTVSLMHNVLYKTFVLESFFLNLYLFFGLVLSVACLYLFKVWLNPSVVGRLFSLSRLKFWFFFASNSRVRTINKLRRQVRRKNTSHLKFKTPRL